MALRIRVGAICRRDDKVLLVEHEKQQQRYWLLPGGGMQRGEPSDAAIVREVHEETGIQVEPGRVVCICESISPDRERHIVHVIFETPHLAGEPAASQDPRVRRSLFMPIESLGQLKLRPPLQEWLQARLSEGFPQEPEYLGLFWI